jgi:hypothetical protein
VAVVEALVEIIRAPLTLALVEQLRLILVKQELILMVLVVARVVAMALVA